MGLSCSCDGWDAEPGMKLWCGPGEYAPLETKRSRRCCSCGEKIKVGDICCEVPIVRVPKHDIEIRIYGEDGEIPIPPKHMCERCADLSFSLNELGYCTPAWEDQRELVKEYAEEQKEAGNSSNLKKEMHLCTR